MDHRVAICKCTYNIYSAKFLLGKCLANAMPFTTILPSEST